MAECHEGNLDTAQSNFAKTGHALVSVVGSGGVDLSTYTGKINIAFKYTGSGKIWL
jgi:hypothetical protein